MKCKTKCIKSGKAGRFKISLLKHESEQRDWDSVAIRYGKKVGGEWQNQTIFCTPYDFRRLKEAIEAFDDADIGGNSPPISKEPAKAVAEVSE